MKKVIFLFIFITLCSTVNINANGRAYTQGRHYLHGALAIQPIGLYTLYDMGLFRYSSLGIGFGFTSYHGGFSHVDLVGRWAIHFFNLPRLRGRIAPNLDWYGGLYLGAEMNSGSTFIASPHTGLKVNITRTFGAFGEFIIPLTPAEAFGIFNIGVYGVF